MTHPPVGAAAPAFSLPGDDGGTLSLADFTRRKLVLYGKTFMGIARTTFLMGPDGKIGRIWTKENADGHAEDVLGAAKSL
jgi:peroxiredoxin Q/BCP